MRVGLKLWSTNAGLLPVSLPLISSGRFQYIELMPVPGTGIEPFLGTGVPFMIHVPGEQFGVNIADRRSHDRSRELFTLAAEWADALRAPSLILHPGYGTLEEALHFLDEMGDDRVMIENMPRRGLKNESLIGATREEIRQLRGPALGFCLDFNHAVKASLSLKIPYRDFVRDLLAETPTLFHISDSRMMDDRDEHLPIGEGEYDIRFFLSCMAQYPDVPITLETPRPSGTLRDDLANRDRLTEYIEDLA